MNVSKTKCKFMQHISFVLHVKLCISMYLSMSCCLVIAHVMQVCPGCVQIQDVTISQMVAACVMYICPVYLLYVYVLSSHAIICM